MGVLMLEFNFIEFIEEVPADIETLCPDLFKLENGFLFVNGVVKPQLYCINDQCDKCSFFELYNPPEGRSLQGITDITFIKRISYRCCNCKENIRLFMLRIHLIRNKLPAIQKLTEDPYYRIYP